TDKLPGPLNVVSKDKPTSPWMNSVDDRRKHCVPSSKNSRRTESWPRPHCVLQIPHRSSATSGPLLTNGSKKPTSAVGKDSPPTKLDPYIRSGAQDILIHRVQNHVSSWLNALPQHYRTSQFLLGMFW